MGEVGFEFQVSSFKGWEAHSKVKLETRNFYPFLRQIRYTGIPVNTNKYPIPEVEGARYARSIINSPASTMLMSGTIG